MKVSAKDEDVREWLAELIERVDKGEISFRSACAERCIEEVGHENGYRKYEPTGTVKVVIAYVEVKK